MKVITKHFSSFHNTHLLPLHFSLIRGQNICQYVTGKVYLNYGRPQLGSVVSQLSPTAASVPGGYVILAPS